MAKIKYVNSNNKSIELGNAAPFIILTIDGLGSPQNEMSTHKSPYQDGVTVTGTSLGPRNIVLEGKIIDSNRENRQTYRNTLISVLNPKLDGKLIIDLGNTQRQIDCKVEQAPYFSSNSEQNYQDFLINLLAPDPYWKDITDKETDLVTWIPNLEFPEGEGFSTEQEPNYWLETEIKENTLEIFENGTIYVEPIVKDTDVYNNGINVRLPIEEIESIKINGMSIDLSTCTVAENRMSFTSTALQNGDLVEYIYRYPQELTTMPTLEIGQYTIDGGIGSLPSGVKGQVSDVVVKGNTYSNAVNNSDFNGTTGWNTSNVANVNTQNGEINFLPEVRYGQIRQVSAVNQHNVGDKLYCRALVKTSSNQTRLLFFEGADGKYNSKIHSGSGSYELLSVVGNLKDKENASYHIDSNLETGFSIICVKEPMVVNLTKIYGAGNEPTKEWCDANLKYISSGTKSTVGASRIKSVGKNLFDGNKLILNSTVNPLDGTFLSVTNGWRSNFIKIEPNISYVANVFGGVGSNFISFYDVNYNWISRLVGNTTILRNFTTPINAKYLIVTEYNFSDSNSALIYANQAKIKLQIEKGTVATPYEPYTESNAYVVAKDNDNKIVNLRSLPNGTKDEISVADGKLVRKSCNYTLQPLDVESVVNRDYVTQAHVRATKLPFPPAPFVFAYQGIFDIPGWRERAFMVGEQYTPGIFSTREDGQILVFDFPLDTTLEQARQQLTGTTLTYQLAKPVIKFLPPSPISPFEDFVSEFGAGESIEFGYREINQIVEIENVGDVEAPIKVVFRADGTVLNPMIQNMITYEQIKIKGTLLAGDELIITTGYGDKNIYLNGEKAQHYYNYLESTWLQLYPGINLIKYDAEEGINNLECRILYTPKYLGV